jgi:hypothetical protein
MEYRVEILGGTMRAPKPHELEALLNQAAEDDWALCKLSYKPNTNQLWVILQRGVPVESTGVRKKSWLADWS